MKMKKLFENWRRYLITEGMNMPDDLPFGVFVCIQKDGDDYFITYCNKNGIALNTEMPVNGTIYIAPTSVSVDGGKCLGAMVVGSSEAKQGWGPLLYDVAMEYSSMIAGGLIADRSMVSEKAYDVWEYYHDSRDDVTKIQLDDPKNTLTPYDDDNCSQDVAVDASQMYFDDPEITWQDTPLSKIYIKKDTTMIDKLEELGKLIKRGI